MPRKKEQVSANPVRKATAPKSVTNGKGSKKVSSVGPDTANATGKKAPKRNLNNSSDKSNDKSSKVSSESLVEKRRFHVLSQSERKKFYSENYGSYTCQDAVQLIEETDRLLMAAKSVPEQILSGQVIGYEESPDFGYLFQIEIDSPEDNKSFKFINYEVKIPITQFMVIELGKYAGPDGKRQLLYEIKSRMWSKVEFVIFDLLETEAVAYGSRLRAMEIRAKNYFHVFEDTKKSKLKVGDYEEARVVSVKTNQIVVEFRGVESVIKTEELTWTSMQELTEEFTCVSDDPKERKINKFRVLIQAIEPFTYAANNRTYTLYKVKCSKRLAEKNPAEKYFKDFPVGLTCAGVVKSQITKGGVYVLAKNKMTVLCPPPKSGTYARGDKCLITITGTDPKTLRLSGRFED